MDVKNKILQGSFQLNILRDTNTKDLSNMLFICVTNSVKLMGDAQEDGRQEQNFTTLSLSLSQYMYMKIRGRGHHVNQGPGEHCQRNCRMIGSSFEVPYPSSYKAR